MKKTMFFILIIIFFLITVYYLFTKIVPSKSYYFPPKSTEIERETIKKLPRDKCGCWDEQDNFCHPQADCI